MYLLVIYKHGTDRLPQIICNELPIYAALYPRKAKISAEKLGWVGNRIQSLHWQREK
jgi:hypothetical protein